MICRTVIVFMIAFGLHWGAQAQYTSRLGRFQVNEVKGCAPFTVNVTIIAPFVCDGANPCDMDFEGDSTFQSLTFTYTYNQPGTYLLRILFQTSGFDDIPVEVTPNIPPAFDVFNCGGYQVSVKLNDTNYDEYVINYNDGSPEVVLNGTGTHNYNYGLPSPQTITVRGRDLNADDNCNSASRNIIPLLTLPAPTITLLEVLDGNRIRLEFNGQQNIQYKLGIATNNATTFQQVITLFNTTVDTIFSLSTDDNYYCFQLAAFDPCNNSVTNSATICSANMDLTVRNNAIDVIWTTASTGISNYRLTRNASDGTLLVTSPAGSPYADTGIICGLDYCYQLTSNYSNGSRSVSLTKCGIGFSTDIPTAIQNITAIVGDNSVVLDWTTDNNFIPAEFAIEKSIAGNYSFLATTTQNAFADQEYKLEDASCYKISYKDVCDNQSPSSVEACPVRLSAGLLKDNSITLSWTPYLGWANGVAGYTIGKYSEDGQLLQTIQVGNITSYVDASDDLNHQTFVYQVNANAAEAGLGQAVSNRVFILKDPNLFHPTAFTPNGDNLNDIFSVFGQYVVGFEMKIFNRWGELLFTTDNIETGWDGNFRGSEMPEGTYSFIAHITDRAGRTFKRSGSVLLLRRRG
ncbi:MAG: gliding motility-associated C-terminal domain-containing protein [Cyclobacteriaceae bacterium]